MAQQEALVAALSGVVNASHSKQLQTVYEAIMGGLKAQPPGLRTGLEALVICAEVALKVRLHLLCFKHRCTCRAAKRLWWRRHGSHDRAAPARVGPGLSTTHTNTLPPACTCQLAGGYKHS